MSKEASPWFELNHPGFLWMKRPVLSQHLSLYLQNTLCVAGSIISAKTKTIAASRYQGGRVSRLLTLAAS
jgi:hypothetical protein